MTAQQIAEVYEVVWDGSVRENGAPPPPTDAPVVVDRIERQRGGTTQRILSALAGYGPLTPHGIATRSGCGEGSVSSILSKLVARGEVIRIQKGGRWTPGLYQVAR